MKKIFYYLSLVGLLLITYSSYSQTTATACGCLNLSPVQTKTYVKTFGSQWSGQTATWVVSYRYCDGNLLIVDIQYTGPADYLGRMNDCMTYVVGDPTLVFNEVLFAGECAGWSGSSTGGWGEGNGPRGTVTVNLVYCTASTTCCRMSKQEAVLVWDGMSDPVCANIYTPSGQYINCYRLCHSAP